MNTIPAKIFDDINKDLKTLNESIRDFIDTSEPCCQGKKYSLTDEQIKRLAYLAYKEQWTVEGTKIELSQMAFTYTGESIETRSNYVPGQTKIYAYSGRMYLQDLLLMVEIHLDI